MPSVEEEFERELEIFRRESESAVQFFYAWESIHAVASKSKSVVAALNTAPLLWNTVLGALQTSAFIALGRVFDQERDTHNIDRLLGLGQRNLQIFSMDALAERKRKTSTNADEWLPEYLQGAYIPTAHDFRRLRKHVAARRRIYEANFRPVRHKVFAHKQLEHLADTNALFGKIKIKEVQQVLVFLRRLHLALQELLVNGRKPVLLPARYSVEQMLALPKSDGSSLQERLTRETEAFLKATASIGKQ